MGKKNPSGKDIETSLSARGSEIPSQHTAAGSALLNIWEYCHRTVEVHRANELEPLSTSGERTPCRLFARSKTRIVPARGMDRTVFKNVRLTIRHNQPSTVVSTVGEPRTEITARSRSRNRLPF